MVINRLKLPASFEQAIQSGLLKREIGSWQLKRLKDCYGNLLETELGDVFEQSEIIVEKTAKLPTDFVVDECYGENEYEHEPGFITDILDFALIVHFADSGDGTPFCFDFRENPNEPSVIWWDDVYWRKIAPSFDAFLELFELNERTPPANLCLND